MHPANKLKLSFVILCFLSVFWYLDRPFPNTGALYDSLPVDRTKLTSQTQYTSPAASIQVQGKINSTLKDYLFKFTQVHPNQTGIYILENALDSLLARAWLADHAHHSIEVQYFKWSNDNIGTLASEALLHAADRGVKVRVIVDDLYIEAEDKTFLALARHPNIEIRIYNPKHRVGTNVGNRLWSVIADFKSANQRMYDKSFVVDGVIAIIGGRDMTSEAFDPHHRAHFLDRDALLIGDAMDRVRANFDNFWQHPSTNAVEKIFAESRLAHLEFDDPEILKIYQQLHLYAQETSNFNPAIKPEISSLPDTFERLVREMIWTKVEFIHDVPGKNHSAGWQGNGDNSRALAQLVRSAKKEILIQSPYLVLSDQVKLIIKESLARGVKISVHTNSLASSDNLQAFSKYREQREDLLKMGLQIYELNPNPINSRRLLHSPVIEKLNPKVFGLHAKSMVIDQEVAYIGTFNFDPRSENLNSEVGVLIYNSQLAQGLAETIKADMQSEYSWNAAKDNPDRNADWLTVLKIRFLQHLPLRPLL
ncbi:phospholipase D-like domain-containing protein [Undibacterium fentianense]|uniref:Phospholipase D family protein n=1 Tax=Undibacterium fentianense TaxID=2828728 RepID=A0A941E409_9BURK|nr:phospholipase D family protein [Undibacterium fentianense]MBR7801111.1 phospholipase D family protein [Undibacterium fentianense]